MNIVIAPDSFKGSLNALAVATALEQGVRRVDPLIRTNLVPMADGGEGTVAALVKAVGGKVIAQRVTGPLGEPVDGYFGLLGDGETGVIEMAAASGLPLLPKERRNPLFTTTYGTGELIKAALDHGARRLIIGIGGSATNDGGAGMAAALGIKLLDSSGKDIPFGGGSLHRLQLIDVSGLDSRIAATDIRVACDVSNPLCGPNGASAVYGPQKGATPEMVELLDKNLEYYAELVARTTGKQVKNSPGAGAAGGLGAGLVAFLGAHLQPGVEIVLHAAKMEELIRDADLVITGEGQTDRQTLYGKAPAGVAGVAQKYDVPVVCISGSLAGGAEELYNRGFAGLFSITDGPMSLDQAMNQAPQLLERAAESVVRLFLAGRSKLS